MAAKNELAQIDAADQTEVNRLEITLKAAKRRAAKTRYAYFFNLMSSV